MILLVPHLNETSFLLACEQRPNMLSGMVKHLFTLGLILATTSGVGLADVLIVADEFPAMEVVAGRLKSEENVKSQVISQKELPTNLAVFEAVVVYIHGALSEKAEDAFIDYAKAGGKLVLLHHSISSGKRKNGHWFPFLCVALPEGDLSKGGYKWIEGISFQLVNLNANHFIMTNRVTYPAHIAYASTNAPVHGDTLPGFQLDETEVYLNHVHTEPRTLLMGLKYTDAETGKTYLQDRAGWIKAAGQGLIIYLMPGHTKKDFQDPTYERIVLNAIIYKP